MMFSRSIWDCKKKDEEYDMGLYQKMHTNIITYETTEIKETQKVEMKDAPILKNVTMINILETGINIKAKFVFSL